MDSHDDYNRRRFLHAGAVGLGSAFVGAMAPPAGAAEIDAWMEDPEQRFRNYLRVTADVSGAVSLNYWRGAYLGIFPDQDPVRLFRMEGCEMRRCIETGSNRYRSEYRLVTSITDAETEEVLNGEEWLNPYTEEVVTIRPNTSSVDTDIWLEDGRILEMSPRYQQPQETHTIMSAVNDMLFVSGYKTRPGNVIRPLIDYGTILADRKTVIESAAPSVPSTFNSTFVAPFQRFMNMPRGEGHAVWHIMGYKLDSWSQIPEHHVAEIEEWSPDVIAWAQD